MFKITPKNSFTAKVALSVPGETRPQHVDVELKHLTKKGIKTYFDNLEGKSDVDALGEIMVGWSGIDVPYSAESLELLLENYPAAGAELFDAFRSELMEARRKN